MNPYCKKKHSYFDFRCDEWKLNYFHSGAQQHCLIDGDTHNKNASAFAVSSLFLCMTSSVLPLSLVDSVIFAFIVSLMCKISEKQNAVPSSIFITGYLPVKLNYMCTCQKTLCQVNDMTLHYFTQIKLCYAKLLLCWHE